MEPDLTNEFTVKFGRYARTVVYNDSEGEIVFTFDLSEKGIKSLKSFVLECDSDEASSKSRYLLATQRAKQYMESCGYEVEIFDAARLSPEAKAQGHDEMMEKILETVKASGLDLQTSIEYPDGRKRVTIAKGNQRPTSSEKPPQNLIKRWIGRIGRFFRK